MSSGSWNWRGQQRYSTISKRSRPLPMELSLPTERQLSYLRALCEKHDLEMPRALLRREAGALIHELRRGKPGRIAERLGVKPAGSDEGRLAGRPTSESSAEQQEEPEA